jgi:hypothetical protein
MRVEVGTLKRTLLIQMMFSLILQVFRQRQTEADNEVLPKYGFVSFQRKLLRNIFSAHHMTCNLTYLECCERIKKCCFKKNLGINVLITFLAIFD